MCVYMREGRPMLVDYLSEKSADMSGLCLLSSAKRCFLRAKVEQHANHVRIGLIEHTSQASQIQALV